MARTYGERYLPPYMRNQHSHGSHTADADAEAPEPDAPVGRGAGGTGGAIYVVGGGEGAGRVGGVASAAKPAATRGAGGRPYNGSKLKSQPRNPNVEHEMPRDKRNPLRVMHTHLPAQN